MPKGRGSSMRDGRAAELRWGVLFVQWSQSFPQRIERGLGAVGEM